MLNKPELKIIAIECLHRNAAQPRQAFSTELLDELAQSIRSSGIIQPLVVRPLTFGDQECYQIIAGERRWRAAQRAGLVSVPCLVNHYTDDQAFEVATIENVSRVDLNPIEEAKAYQRLAEQFHYTHDEIAAAIGKSRVKITHVMRLLKLHPRCQEWLIEGKLTEGHGKILAGLPASEQVILGEKVIIRQWSVRQLEVETRKIKHETPANSDPNLVALEKCLSDKIGCRSEISFHQGMGKVIIDFQNLDVLQGLLARLGINFSNPV